MAKVVAEEKVHRENGSVGVMFWFTPDIIPSMPKNVRCLRTGKSYHVGVVPQYLKAERQYVILLGRENNIRLEATVFARLLSQSIFEIVH